MNEDKDFARKKQAIKYLRWGIVVLLMLGMINSYFDRMNMSFAASSISREFGRWVQIFKFIFPDSAKPQKIPVNMDNNHALIGNGTFQWNGENSSLAYFLHRKDTVWTVATHFIPDSIFEKTIIARSVAVDGDYAVISAVETETGGRIVYVLQFQKSSDDSAKGEWKLQTRLLPPDSALPATFGEAVSLDENQIIVGAPGKKGEKGRAFIFQRIQNEWIQTACLSPEENQIENGEQFGHSVTIDRDYAMVGYPDGNHTKGKVVVFKRENNQWKRSQELVSVNGDRNDQFGCAVAMDGEFAIIGAEPADSGLEKTGSAFIYERKQAHWELHAVLYPADSLQVTHFGGDVALKGNYAIVSAQTKKTKIPGAAIIFHREGKRWIQQSLLTPESVEMTAQLGRTVAVNEQDYALVSGKMVDTNNAVAFIFRHYPIDPAKMGLILAMFFWAYGIMQVPAGRLVDKFGIRKLYTTSFFIWAFVATAFGLATSIWMFVVLRALLGILESVSAPASMAFIGRYFDEAERGLATGIYLAGTKLGPSIGGILAAWLIGTFGWRMLFILCGLIPLIWLLPWEYYYRILEKRLGERGIKSEAAKTDGINSTARKKLIPLKTIFKYRKTWGVFWGSAAYSYVLVLYLSWLPTYFREQMHFSLAKMGAFSGIAFGGVALMVPLAGAAADFLIRKGWDTSSVRKGFIIAGFLMGALIIPVPFISNPDYAVSVLLIAIVSMGMATANTWAIMQAIAPENTTGTLAGVQNLGGSVGSAVAPLLTGFMVSTSGTFNSAFILAGLIMLSGILNYIFLIGKVERIQID